MGGKGVGTASPRRRSAAAGARLGSRRAPPDELVGLVLSADGRACVGAPGRHYQTSSVFQKATWAASSAPPSAAMMDYIFSDAFLVMSTGLVRGKSAGGVGALLQMAHSWKWRQAARLTYFIYRRCSLLI